MIAPRTRCASSMLANAGSLRPKITGTPLARHDQLRADGDAGEESIEVGKLHAVFRSTIGHQEVVECVEVEVTRAKQRRAHAPLLHRVISFADCRRFWHALDQITSLLC